MDESLCLPLFYRLEDSSLSAPRSVKDAWTEISAALYENSASSSYTPFTVCVNAVVKTVASNIAAIVKRR